jgi:5-methylcytosine-specific restriction endonuclease McrA
VKNHAGKKRRLKLDPAKYEILHRQVLERDGWRCQFCGSMLHLQVHHLKFRSRSGGDEEQNLITLCARCHEKVHASHLSEDLND